MNTENNTSDIDIYRAMSIVSEYNEKKYNNQNEKYIKENVADWEKQCKIYNRNLKNYTQKEQQHELEKLNRSRPSQYDFSIARGKSKLIYYKSKEVREAEKLLERVYSQIGSVLGRNRNPIY